jgi:DNA-binding protein H-NS
MATQTYSDLTKQIQKLQAQAEAIRESERASVIKTLNESIRAYAISAQELSFTPKAAKTAAPSQRAPGTKYSDGSGNVWGGMGPRPGWLREAIAQGKRLEDFLPGAAAPTKAAAVPKKAAKKKPSGRPTYRDDAGNTWTGMGPKPRWLKEGIAAGKSLEDFQA